MFSPGRPVPAHPLPHVRRAGGLAAPADRRPGGHRRPLPAWRDRVHRRGGHRLAAPDERGPVGAAGRACGPTSGRGSSSGRGPSGVLPKSGTAPPDAGVRRHELGLGSWITNENEALTVQVERPMSRSTSSGERAPGTSSTADGFDRLAAAAAGHTPGGRAGARRRVAMRRHRWGRGRACSASGRRPLRGPASPTHARDRST